jgi:hypothetical protein
MQPLAFAEGAGGNTKFAPQTVADTRHAYGNFTVLDGGRFGQQTNHKYRDHEVWVVPLTGRLYSGIASDSRRGRA